MVLVLILASCEHRDQQDGFAVEASRVMDAIAIAGSSVAATLRISRHRFMATATWELSLPTTWARYRDALNLTSLGYRELSADASGTTLARSTPGDAFSLRIDKVSESAPLHVRFTLTAIPD